MRGACVAAAMAMAVADAAPRPDRGAPPATFENAEALAPWRAALAAQRAGTMHRPVRIAFFGDSLTADDRMTHRLRAKLGALVGDGGPGFVFAAKPHPYCQHRAVSRSTRGDWRVHGVSSSPARDRLLGLGGSAETHHGRVRLRPRTPVHWVDVHYLEQPRGGTLAVVAGGAVLAELATAAERKQAAFARVALPEGTQQIELRATGRVRLFGAALERNRGVVVDNLGVVNATAKQLHKHNRPAHWRGQLAHRDADLVIVMLGTNEAEWLAPRSTGMAEHERLFGELLASVRAANPDGACLAISPLDQLDWRDPELPPRASIPALVEAQRRAALAAGCAFWNTYEWMGGSGASRAWFQARWVLKDFQHPTAAGAARIADALYAGLTR